MGNPSQSSSRSPFHVGHSGGVQVFVVDADHGRRARIAYALGNEGVFATPAECATQIDRPASGLTLIVCCDEFADPEQAIWNLKAANPHVVVMLYAEQVNLRSVVRSIRAGALDYFAWPEETAGLVASVKSLTSLSDHLDTAPDVAPAPPPAPASTGYSAVAILDSLVNGWSDERARKNTALQRLGKLTEREREILAMLSQGMSSAQIAEALGISPRTVETHRANILMKTGSRSSAEAIRYAVESGIA